MRYGPGKVLDCLFSGYGVVRHMSNIWRLINSHPSPISASLWGILFKVKVVVSRAYPQNCNGRSDWLIIDRTMSNNVWFRRSDNPFHWGVPGGVSCGTIPHFFRWSPNSWLKYSSPRSDRRHLIVLPSWLCTSFGNSLNFSKDTYVSSSRHSHIYWNHQ